jgi:hypothetical protein
MDTCLTLHNLESVIALPYKRDYKVIFTVGDITHSETLDPFTHVYSFDVGFPPSVMDCIADNFNRSGANYFVSFHGPKKVIVEIIGRVATSMAGSSEGHTCYMYRRTELSALQDKRKIDPLFGEGFELLKQGGETVQRWIEKLTGNRIREGKTRRQKRAAKMHQQGEEGSMVKTLEAYYYVIPRNEYLACA